MLESIDEAVRFLVDVSQRLRSGFDDELADIHISTGKTETRTCGK